MDILTSAETMQLKALAAYLASFNTTTTSASCTCPPSSAFASMPWVVVALVGIIVYTLAWALAFGPNLKPCFERYEIIHCYSGLTIAANMV